MRMTLRRMADHLAVKIIECRKQRDRSVADVVVGLGANMAHTQRQAGLRSLERLALALFVTTQHQRLLRRLKVQPNDVPEFSPRTADHARP